MLRFGFGLALVSSLAMAGGYIAVENNSPGLSIGTALLIVPSLLSAFGLFASHSTGLTRDGKIAAVIAFVVAIGAVAYLGVFFGGWLFVGLGWLVTLVPMLIAAGRANIYPPW